MADHLMTEVQKMLVQEVREFAAQQIRAAALASDETGEINKDVYDKAVSMGLNAMMIPTELGGVGLDCFTECLLTEEIAKGDPAFANRLAATSLAALPIKLGKADALYQKACKIIVNGGIGAFALTEPNAGSDAGSIQTSAVKCEDGYVLNGRKCFITNGGIADFYVVFAKTDKGAKTRGITAFFVERGQEGVHVGKKEKKMGLCASNTADVILDHVLVPYEHVIGEEGGGFRLAMQTLDYSRITCAATAVGISQAAIDLCKSYVKERNVFGNTLSKMQTIQFLLADMEIRTQASRALALQAATLADEGQINTKISSCAKVMASDTAMQVTTDAVQIFGGYGYMKGMMVEKLMRDAKVYQIFEGTNQIQRMIISGVMLR